jgi:hypothetical protein
VREHLVRNHAATLLQATWYRNSLGVLIVDRRGYYTRKTIKQHSSPVLSHIPGNQVDSVVISLVARVQQEAQSRHMLEEAVRFMWKEVQSLRGELNGFKQREEKQASTIIQTYWRAYRARKLYSLMKEHKELT